MCAAPILTTTSCPDKPYPEFSLHAHKSGRWAKKKFAARPAASVPGVTLTVP